jgi:hypothetical protein
LTVGVCVTEDAGEDSVGVVDRPQECPQYRADSDSMCPVGTRMSRITDSPLPGHVAQGSRIARIPYRRDSLPWVTHSQLPLGVRRRYQGVLRRDRPHRSYGAGAEPGRRQTCPTSGEGVPQSWCPHRGRQPPSDYHRYTPRRNTLTAASQHCPVNYRHQQLVA